MHKQLVNPTTIQGKTSSGLGSWYSAFKGWSEARELRKQERQREELLSELPPYILYTTGESDCRPRDSSSDLWDNNSYRLLIDAIARRKLSEFDSSVRPLLH
jgi:hypothetical protein